MTEPLVLDVERLAFGFDAIAHHEGQVVFLPYAAPGDRVMASVVAHHSGYLQAEIDTVLRPGPARVLPGCSFFPLAFFSISRRGASSASGWAVPRSPAAIPPTACAAGGGDGIGPSAEGARFIARLRIPPPPRP